MINDRYYSSEELDDMIMDSLVKNAKEVAIEIKNEKIDFSEL